MILTIFRGVIDTVVRELKQILKRDVNKKMIENTAFKWFENWWDEQERKAKVRADVPYACTDVDSSPTLMSSGDVFSRVKRRRRPGRRRWTKGTGVQCQHPEVQIRSLAQFWTRRAERASVLDWTAQVASDWASGRPFPKCRPLG